MSDEMDEIWVLFADDGAQAMDAMEVALLSLQDSAPIDQPPLVAALFRAVHTFKGNSRVLGLETVESRAHLAEDLIGLVRDRGVPLDAEILSLLLETGDRLREMLDETAQNRADVDPTITEPLVMRLRDKIARCSAEADGATVPDDLPEPGALPSETAPATAPYEQETAPVETAETVQEPVDFVIAETYPADHNTESTQPAAMTSPAPTVTASLAQDAAYLTIFNEMVSDALKKLHKAKTSGDVSTIKRVLPGLLHAARQLGLEIWQDVLSALPQHPQASELDEIILSIEMLVGDTPPVTQQTTEQIGFFARIADPLAVVSRLGLNFSTGEAPDETALSQAVAALCAISAEAGYVRVTSAARTLPAAGDAAAFRRSELRLYEELASVELALGDTDTSTGISPRKLLQNWCADNIFETLDELNNVLERLRKGTDGNADQRALERLIRLVHHACRHFQLDIASDLAMSILDLFSRGHTRGDRPDAILLQIARGFVDTLELVFDAMREGETPDVARLEQLFREASEAGFIGAGTVTAGTIERRLGLPESFHRVLSPESTRATSQAIDQGKKFYLLRADINSDDRLAEALFDLIGSGQLEALTNVTVFEGDKTIFDFLIAAEQDEVWMAATLATLDPSGKKLVLLQSLNPVESTTTQDNPSNKGDDSITEGIPSAEFSSEMLEQLSEVAAGQAMLQSMLGDLSSVELSETLDAVLRQHGHDLRSARQALRAVGDQLTEQMREIAQLGAQILGHMSEMQQLTASLRTRPAETILRPLSAMVAAQSRSNGFEATLTTTGSEQTLDVSLLNCLRSSLRPFLQARLAQPVQAPRRLHLAIRKLDDQVSAVLEDDGSIAPSAEQLAAMAAELLPHGGSLRMIRRPEGGFRLHLFLPINLVVLDGMVVGANGTRYVLPVSAIRSILQPEATAMVPISDLDGQQIWLRMNGDELIPICDISGSTTSDHAERKRASNGKERVHVVLSLPDSCVAVPVDELLGQQLVVSRPLRGIMSGMSNISGVALLSRGDVAMVLSPARLCPARAREISHQEQTTH